MIIVESSNLQFGLYMRQWATSVLSELLIFECNSNPGFLKYLGLVVKTTQVSGRRK